MKQVGERLRSLRESIGVSQAKLAEILEVSQSGVARYEQGISTPTVEVFRKYADYFDVSMDYIFARCDDQRGKLYEAKPPMAYNNPEIAQFVEMCFDPSSSINSKLEGNAGADVTGGGKMSQNTPKKAVIYARYSSDSQREESIEGQIRECMAFAEKERIMVLHSYVDRAISGKTDDRPEFQQMIKDSGKKLFDTIIVWKLDRFARNRYDSAKNKNTLKKNNVKVISATETISAGSEGILLEAMLEGMAEYYVVELSEKVVRGMTENALKCKFNGGTVPLGYCIDEEQYFQINELTAPFVVKAFEKYEAGFTITQIMDWLNEQGVKNTLGKPMNFNSVQHLLKNRRYIGEYRFQDIIVPDGIPAIVPQDLFDRVQERLEKNKKAPARRKAEDDYILTSKLFCGHCGAGMVGESGKGRNGDIHRYYKCLNVKNKRKKRENWTECHKKSVRKEWIEDLVVNETKEMLSDDKAIEAIVGRIMEVQSRESINLPIYEKQLREAEKGIENLLNAIQQGIFTRSTKQRLEELENQKEDMETRIAAEKLEKPHIDPEFMTFFFQRFRKLDLRLKDHRKMLIDTFVNAIYLFDDKLVLTFNYKDGTKTITFDELNTALKNEQNGSDLDCSGAPKKRRPTGRLFFGPVDRLEPI